MQWGKGVPLQELVVAQALMFLMAMVMFLMVMEKLLWRIKQNSRNAISGR
jgi:hypothetical protein